jgi:hypothetical protein
MRARGGGELYRDLIPGRSAVATYLALIPGGPIADWVHFHHRATAICVRALGARGL